MKGNKYEAQGFIEALMAILIAGIAVVAFMAVTTRTLGQVAKNEIRDQLVQEAVQGSTILDYIVENRNVNNTITGTEALFLADSKLKCFEVDGDFSTANPIVIGANSSDALCNLEPIDGGIVPSACLGSEANWNKAVIKQKDSTDRYDYQNTMFRIVCIDADTSFDDTNGGVLITRIYTGTESCRDYNTTVRTIDSVDESCVVQEFRSVYRIEALAP